jgi:DNA repair protein RadC
MHNPNAGHRERLKRRFMEAGLRGFEPHNALELLLFYAVPRADTNRLAHALIERFGSLANVFDAGAKELTAVDGISFHTAALIKLIPSMAAIYCAEKSRIGFTFLDIDAAAAYLREYFVAETREVGVLLIFGDSGEFLASKPLADGNIVALETTPRKIAELTLAARGSKIILSHFHPTPDATPSAADIRLTGALRRALAAIDIEFVEHIIICRSGGTIALIEWAKNSPETMKLLHGRD